MPSTSVPNIYFRAGAYEVYLSLPERHAKRRTYIGRRHSLEEAIALRDEVLATCASKEIICTSRRSYDEPRSFTALRRRSAEEILSGIFP